MDFRSILVTLGVLKQIDHIPPRQQRCNCNQTCCMVDVLPNMLDLNVLWICVLLARARPDTKVLMIPTHVLSGASDRLARFKQLLTFCAVGSRDHATHALIEHGALLYHRRHHKIFICSHLRSEVNEFARHRHKTSRTERLGACSTVCICSVL